MGADHELARSLRNLFEVLGLLESQEAVGYRLIQELPHASPRTLRNDLPERTDLAVRAPLVARCHFRSSPPPRLHDTFRRFPTWWRSRFFASLFFRHPVCHQEASVLRQSVLLSPTTKTGVDSSLLFSILGFLALILGPSLCLSAVWLSVLLLLSFD
jgi:hypothetical protein